METDNKSDSQLNPENKNETQPDVENKDESQLDKEPPKDEYSSHLKILNDLKVSDVKKRKKKFSRMDAEDCCQILCFCCLIPCQLCENGSCC